MVDFKKSFPVSNTANYHAGAVITGAVFKNPQSPVRSNYYVLLETANALAGCGAGIFRNL